MIRPASLPVARLVSVARSADAAWSVYEDDVAGRVDVAPVAQRVDGAWRWTEHHVHDERCQACVARGTPCLQQLDARASGVLTIAHEAAELLS